MYQEDISISVFDFDEPPRYAWDNPEFCYKEAKNRVFETVKLSYESYLAGQKQLCFDEKELDGSQVRFTLRYGVYDVLERSVITSKDRLEAFVEAVKKDIENDRFKDAIMARWKAYQRT